MQHTQTQINSITYSNLQKLKLTQLHSRTQTYIQPNTKQFFSTQRICRTSFGDVFPSSAAVCLKQNVLSVAYIGLWNKDMFDGELRMLVVTKSMSTREQDSLTAAS